MHKVNHVIKKALHHNNIHRITTDAKSSNLIEIPQKFVLNIIPQTSTIMNQKYSQKATSIGHGIS